MLARACLVNCLLANACLFLFSALLVTANAVLACLVHRYRLLAEYFLVIVRAFSVC